MVTIRFSSTNNVVGIAVGVGGGGGGASATAVDIAVGNAVAANDDDAVDAVVPPLSTKDGDAYVSASVAFEGACVGTFADGAAAANVALSRCRQIKIFHTLSRQYPICLLAYQAEKVILFG